MDILKLYNSTSSSSFKREWYDQFDKGTPRVKSFGKSTQDPDLVFNGKGVFIINGTDIPNNGEMTVTGSYPCFYIRNDKETWCNTETTLYTYITDPSSTIGIHILNDSYTMSSLPLTCSARKYSVKIDCMKCVIEKNCGSVVKRSNYSQFIDVLPLNKWIGIKTVCRVSDKCKIDVYIDTTEGLNGGAWKSCFSFVDFDGWSADCDPCCEIHRGKILGRNKDISISTENVQEQRYKWISVREIDETS